MGHLCTLTLWNECFEHICGWAFYVGLWHVGGPSASSTKQDGHPLDNVKEVLSDIASCLIKIIGSFID